MKLKICLLCEIEVDPKWYPEEYTEKDIIDLETHNILTGELDLLSETEKKLVVTLEK